MKILKKILPLGVSISIGLMPALCFAADPVVAEPASTDIAQSLFEEAMKNRDSGDVFKAIRLFEQITQNQPELKRARLELAVAYHQANRYQDAIRELKLVLADKDTPDNVRLSILAYLGQVQNDEKAPEGKHQFSYYLKAGVLNNSNLNASQAVVTGLNTSSAARISSLGTDLTANASHRYSKRDLLNIANTAAAIEWQSQATVNSNLYSEDSNFNLNILSLSTGPGFISPGRWRASIPIQADYIQLGSDHLATFVTFGPNVTFDFGHFRSLLLETSYTTHEYQDAANRGYDGAAFMVGSGYTTYFPEHDAGFEAGFRLTQDNADQNAFSHDQTELYLASFIAFDPQMNAYARLNTRQYKFDAPDPNVGVTRDESEFNIAIGFNYDHLSGLLKGWQMNVEFSAVDSDSNANTLDYKRNILSINWSRYFQ